MRILYHVPISHMLGESAIFEKAYLETLKPKKKIEFFKHEEEIFEEWKQINEKIKSKIKKGNIDCSRLLIYQDGWSESSCAELSLAIAEKEPNMALLARLTARGAKIIATEDKKLIAKQKECYLDEEILFFAVKQIEKSKDINFQGVILKRISNRQKAFRNKSKRIARARDKHVAKRIEQTLVENFTGILFMGKLHKVVEKLNSSEFEVINLLKEQ